MGRNRYKFGQSFLMPFAGRAASGQTALNIDRNHRNPFALGKRVAFGGDPDGLHRFLHAVPPVLPAHQGFRHLDLKAKATRNCYDILNSNVDQGR